MKVTIIGGTGKLGFGLARRLASIGIAVMIGSREKQKAIAKAEELKQAFTNADIYGEALSEAAKWGDIVFITVPYAAYKPTVEQIKHDVEDKIIVDTTVPLNTKNPSEQLDSVTSVAEDISQILGGNTKLVSAFHTVSHTILNNLSVDIDGDVLVCGNDEEAIQKVCDLIKGLGARPVIVGGLKNSRVLERLTPMIIGMNKRYKKRHIGIKVSGIDIR